MSSGPWKRGVRHCEIPECEQRHVSRGLCSAHYQAQRKAEKKETRVDPSSEHLAVRGPEDLPNVRRSTTYQGRWGVILRRPNMEEAACVNTDPDVFFPDSAAGNAYDEARTVCAGCPIRRGCAEWGIAAEQEGMFGGLSPHQRRRIRAVRGQFAIDPWSGHKFAGMDEWDWGRKLTGYATRPKATQDEEHWEFSEATRERAAHASRARWGAS